jgi:nicotinate-nucleotide pyrophosphorylase (carboxylating)
MNGEQFDWLLDAALREDAAHEDVTTLALIPEGAEGEALVRACEAGVICGVLLAQRMAMRFDGRIGFTACIQDGDAVQPGDVVARLSGPIRSILAIERSMLNVLRRLSGVATLTKRFVDCVDGLGALIYDTRKTTPGWRRLEKYAVRCGGGSNHRMSLRDAVLIKDNHLALLAQECAADEAVQSAVRHARDACPGLTVEVEVDDLDQLKAALPAGPDVVMLDNFAPDQVREARALIEGECPAERRPLIEVSGNVTLENVAEYAQAGADRIAVGSLTHSAPALDLSLDVVA